MIVLSLLGVDLNKGIGPSVSVGTPSASPTPGGGGQQKGPGGKEREGHKYISREWEGDHWEYDYGDEPHPERHGLEHAVSDKGHSLMAPQHVDPQLHDDMSPEDRHAALEEAYKQSRRHMMMPGMKWELPHPGQGKEGQSVHFEVVARGVNDNTPNGFGIIVRESPSINPKTGKEVKGKVVGVGKERGAGSLAAAEKWYIKEKYTRSFPDPVTGEEAYRATPNLGKVNHATDRIEQGKSASSVWSRYNLIFPKGSHEHTKDLGGKGGGVDRMPFNTWEDLQHQVDKFDDAKATEAGTMPSMEQLLQEKSPLQIAKDSHFPRERDPGRAEKGKGKLGFNKARVVHAKYDSPEQKQQMFNSMAQELSSTSEQLWSRLLKKKPELEHSDFPLKDLLTGTGESGVLPGSAMERFLDRALTRGQYKEHKGKEGNERKFETYMAQSLGHDFAQMMLAEGLITVADAKKMQNESTQLASDIQEAKDFLEQQGGNVSGAVPEDMNVMSGDVEAAEEEAAEGYKPQSEEDFGLNMKIADWRTQQNSKIDNWVKEVDPDLGPLLKETRDRIDRVNGPEDVESFVSAIKEIAKKRYVAEGLPVVADNFNTAIDHKFEKSLILFLTDTVKSLTAVFTDHMAVKALQRDLARQIIKAKVTAPDPQHEYSHREGMDDDPSFIYNDPVGNNVRYTNAPEGSADYSPFGGAPKVHGSEPSMEMAPEYFTPDGRKLTRAPHPMAQMQWNPNYHANDPSNLWAGRWVNPVTGEHEYTYIDSDVRGHDKLRIHQQNRLVDIRLPHLRRYVSGLLHSNQPKDLVIGLMLAVVDQGRVHPVELAKLKSGEVRMHGDIIRFGRFAVHAGEKIQQIVRRMMTVRSPEDSFFSAPVMRNAPDSVIGVDTEFRTIGPHYIARTLSRLGTPLGALQSYHATQTYSIQLQRCIQGTNVSMDCGKEFALLEVARRMGHDFENEPDVNRVLKQILETMIDPVAIEVMEQNARASGDDQGSEDMTRQVVLAVPHISANIQSHTNAEKEFGKWVHAHPFHEHAETRRTYEAA